MENLNRLESALQRAAEAFDGTVETEAAFVNARNAREAYHRYQHGGLTLTKARALIAKNGVRGFSEWNGSV